MADISLCVRLSKECHEELPSVAGPYEVDRVYDQLPPYLSGAVDKITFLAGDYGVLIAFAVPTLYTYSYQAYELLWYVQPDYRRHRDALRLFLAYEMWAEHIGCTSIQAATVHGWTDLTSFYEKHGYVKTETSFRKTLWESK